MDGLLPDGEGGQEYQALSEREEGPVGWLDVLSRDGRD